MATMQATVVRPQQLRRACGAKRNTMNTSLMGLSLCLRSKWGLAPKSDDASRGVPAFAPTRTAGCVRYSEPAIRREAVTGSNSSRVGIRSAEFALCWRNSFRAP